MFITTIQCFGISGKDHQWLLLNGARIYTNFTDNKRTDLSVFTRLVSAFLVEDYYGREETL